jgi:hypothetical protein
MSPADPRADYQLVENPPRDTPESENLTVNVEERTSTESSQLSNGWFRLFRVVLDSHGSNLVAIAGRFANAKVPWTSTLLQRQHSSGVC